MAKKVKLSPIVTMVRHWQRMILEKGPMDITSLVMRIAAQVGLVEGSPIMYLPMTEGYQTCIDLEDFVQGHLMHEGPNDSLFICYPRYIREVELPCPILSLLGIQTNPADEERTSICHSVAGLSTGPVTQGKAA